MYGYEEFNEITSEQILTKVTQEQIFQFVLEELFDWNTRYRSPFREHSKANIGTCRFEQREDGTILFVDFGEKFLTSRTHRNCFRMVMEKFNLSFPSAIRFIIQVFNLSTDSKDYPLMTSSSSSILSYQKKSPKTDTDMTYVPKEFNKFDVQHWSQFLIRPEELFSDQVYSVRTYTIDNHKGKRTYTPYKYCYVIDFLDAIKIYQPYSKEYKWITNCTEDHIGNIDNIAATGDELIIQKSYKDHRVLRNIMNKSANVVWFMNEGTIPSLEILSNLVSRFRLITVFFDNDRIGTLAAMKLTEILNTIREDCARMVHMPLRVPKGDIYKDPAECINREGRVDLIHILKYIGL